MAVQEGNTAPLEHTFKNRTGRHAPARFVFPAGLDLEPFEFEKSTASDDTESFHLATQFQAFASAEQGRRVSGGSMS